MLTFSLFSASQICCWRTVPLPEEQEKHNIVRNCKLHFWNKTVTDTFQKAQFTHEYDLHLKCKKFSNCICNFCCVYIYSFFHEHFYLSDMPSSCSTSEHPLTPSEKELKTHPIPPFNIKNWKAFLLLHKGMYGNFIIQKNAITWNVKHKTSWAGITIWFRHLPACILWENVMGKIHFLYFWMTKAKLTLFFFFFFFKYIQNQLPSFSHQIHSAYFFINKGRLYSFFFNNK